MPRRYWSAVSKVGLTAFILLAISSSGWLIYESHRLQSAYERSADRNAQGYADRARIAIEGRCISVPPAQLRDCISGEAHTARQGQHDEYDLEAQRTMATWTRAMGIAAIIGMTVGIFGIGLVFVTFQETRRANVLARETLEGQLRPWIDFRVSRNGWLEIVDDNLELWTKVTFHNRGPSPAIDLTYTGTMIFGDAVDPQFKRIIEDFRSDNHDWADKNLFPDGEWEQNVGAVHTGDRDFETQITFVVVARYKTPFSNTYRFTARAFEIIKLKTTLSGGFDKSGPLIDLRQITAAHKEILGLSEKRQFSGYAT